MLTETARCVVVGVGLLLWLAGGKLLKSASILGGLMLGMILGGLTLAFLDSAVVAVGFMVGLGLLGAIAAWLAFRFWVSVVAAIMLAIIAPAAVMAYQGTPTQPLAEDALVATEQIKKRYETQATKLDDPSKLMVQQLMQQGDRESLVEADQIMTEQGADLADSARKAVFQNLEDIQTWWNENSTSTHRTIGIAMLMGAGLGFLIGMVAPTYAAAAQSALVGAVLIVIPGRELIMTQAAGAAEYVPVTARGTLILLGLITLVGMLVQWTLHLRRDDKKVSR